MKNEKFRSGSNKMCSASLEESCKTLMKEIKESPHRELFPVQVPNLVCRFNTVLIQVIEVI